MLPSHLRTHVNWCNSTMQKESERLQGLDGIFRAFSIDLTLLPMGVSPSDSMGADAGLHSWKSHLGYAPTVQCEVPLFEAPCRMLHSQGGADQESAGGSAAWPSFLPMHGDSVLRPWSHFQQLDCSSRCTLAHGTIFPLPLPSDDYPCPKISYSGHAGVEILVFIAK